MNKWLDYRVINSFPIHLLTDLKWYLEPIQTILYKLLAYFMFQEISLQMCVCVYKYILLQKYLCCKTKLIVLGQFSSNLQKN